MSPRALRGTQGLLGAEGGKSVEEKEPFIRPPLPTGSENGSGPKQGAHVAAPIANASSSPCGLTIPVHPMPP